MVLRFQLLEVERTRKMKEIGGFFYFIFLFYFFIFYNQVFVVKVQETTWSASYGRNKTMKQSNGPLHLGMGQTNTPHP